MDSESVTGNSAPLRTMIHKNLKEDNDWTMSSEESMSAEKPIPSRDPRLNNFQRGDHVYQWCSVLGVPWVYQHHGIVLHVELIEDGEGRLHQRLTIADFSNFLPQSSASEHSQQPDSDQQDSKGETSDEDGAKSSASLMGGRECTGGILRVYTTTSKHSPWYKVEYNAPLWKTWFRRGGISTTVAASDGPEVVLNRVNVLLRHRSERGANDDTFRSSVLPRYHILFANCECVAMWCKTGRFGTLQGASLLAGTAATTGGGTAAICQAAAASLVTGTTTIAAVDTTSTASIAGMLASRLSTPAASGGSLAGTSLSPWIAGALTTYGAVTIGGCTVTLFLARTKWNATTKRLNEALRLETMRATMAS